MVDDERGRESGLIFGSVQRVAVNGNVLRIRPSRRGVHAPYSMGSELLIRILDVEGEEGATPSDLIGKAEIATARVLERSGEKELELIVPDVIDEETERITRERFVTGVQFDILGGF